LIAGAEKKGRFGLGCDGKRGGNRPGGRAWVLRGKGKDSLFVREKKA